MELVYREVLRVIGKKERDRRIARVLGVMIVG